MTTAAVIGCAFAGQALAQTAPHQTATGRGELVSAVALRSLSPAQVRTTLEQAQFSADMVTYGVEMYRLIYRTVDPRGRRTVASGLLVLPQAGPRHPRLVSFAHGTESYRDDAPSAGGDDFAYSPAVSFAAAGYGAVSPDYLGLGVGPGPHPWMDVPSETSASLDMLRAARSFMADRGRTPQRDVLVSGFSQGASAALGLARALSDGADRRFRLRAVAPISGGYDFQHAEIPALLDKDGPIPGKLAVIYTTYLFVAWNRLHHIYDEPSQVFQKPYAARVTKLFDGSTPGQEMYNSLPDRLDELLTGHGFALLRHPSAPLRAALARTDGTCAGWIPRAPIRLYYATGDEQAVNANTDRCQAAFRASGLNLTPIDLGPHDYQGSRHLGTEVTGTTAVLTWFRSLSA